MSSMTMRRKSWWAMALSLPFAAFAAGCSSEPAIEVSTEGSPGISSPAPVTELDKAEAAKKTEAPPATPADAPKADAPADAPKADAPKADAPAEAPKVEAPKVEAPKGASTVKLSDEQLAEVKKLPADDQALALKQTVCPISDEPLGAMGVPVKIMAEGKAVFVCCKGCGKDVEANPAAALAKLGLK